MVSDPHAPSVPAGKMVYDFRGLPWPHVIVDDFLLPDELSSIIKDVPSIETEGRLNRHGGQPGKDPNRTHHTATSDAIGNKYDGNVREIYTLMTGRTSASLRLNTYLEYRPASWRPHIHIDNEHKMLSCVLYLTEDSPETSGTTLHSENKEVTGYVVPKINRLFAFAAHQGLPKWHSAGYITGVGRPSLNFVILDH